MLFTVVRVFALAIAALFGRLPEVSQLAGVALAIFGVLLASGRLTAPALTVETQASVMACAFPSPHER